MVDRRVEIRGRVKDSVGVLLADRREGVDIGLYGLAGLIFFVIEPLMATSRITGASSFLKAKLLRMLEVAGPA
jgi:uncharacterized membrane protein